MDTNQTGVLDGLDPEITERLASRRDMLRRGGVAVAAASVPLAVGALARSAFAQGGLPKELTEVLNFALTLEFLEAEFYNKGLNQEGLIPEQDRPIYQTISEHEDAHVDFLKETLGNKATKKPKFDFTANGKFDTFDNYETFRLLSIGFEDTGVRAYKGGAILNAEALLDNPKILTAALTIHSVEAQHAARVRQLLGFQGWIPFEFPDAPKPVQPIYATDASLAEMDPSFDVETTTKYGIDVAEVSEVKPKQITEAFDEPLGPDAVLKIVDQFIAS